MSRQLTAEIGRLAHTHGVPACVQALASLMQNLRGQGCVRMPGATEWGELSGGGANVIAELWADRLVRTAASLREDRRNVMNEGRIVRPTGGAQVVNDYFGVEDFGAIAQNMAVFVEGGIRQRTGNSQQLLMAVRALYGMPMRGFTSTGEAASPS